MSTPDRENKHAAVEPPQRRRGKRKALAVLAIALLIAAVWTMAGPGEAIRKARRLNIGMSYDEVLAIMGHPNVTTTARPAATVPENAYFGNMGRAFKEGFMLWLGARAGVNLPISDLSDWPVHVRFDANGRVDRIKRGSEVVESPVNSTK